MAAEPRKTLLYLGISLASMFAGSAFVQALVHTDMDLTKEIEKVRESRRLQRQQVPISQAKPVTSPPKPA